MRRFLQIWTFILLWGLLLGGGFVFYDAHRFLNTPASAEPEELLFSISPGATFDRVAWDLKKAGAISDVFRFRLLAQYHDALGRVRAGEYQISTGWTPDQVLRQITQGQAVLYRLSIREGLTWWETAQAVADQGFALYDDFAAVIHDPEFLRTHNIPFSNAEGFLYPETYLLKKPRSPLDKQQARDVADAMVRMFWKKTEPIWRELPQRPGSEAALPGAAAGAMASPSSAPSEAPLSRELPPQAEVQNGPGAQRESGAKSAQVNGTNAPPITRPATAVQASASSQARPAATGGRAATALRPETTATPSVNGLPSGRSGEGAVYRANASQTIAPAVSPLAHESDPPPAPGNATLSVPTVSDAGHSSNATQASPSASMAADTATAAPPAEPSRGPQSPADIAPEALKRLVTLASLVEKETGVPEERMRVAGVYANRLRLNMLLQCDPTIIYGLGKSFSGAIRRSQIDDPKNPYNTYQHPGLPPGPICSSGLAALQAAFRPERHDYLYFVATGVDARHTFSKTLNEHNKAVQVYRARMRGKK